MTQKRLRRQGQTSVATVLVLAIGLVAVPAVSGLGRATGDLVSGLGQAAVVKPANTTSVIGHSSQAALASLGSLAHRFFMAADSRVGWDKLAIRRTSARGFKRRPLPTHKELRETYTNILAWPGYNRAPINPIADWENCSACSIALDHTLEGNPSQALPFTVYAANTDLAKRVETLINDKERFRKAVKGLDSILEQSLAVDHIEPQMATNYTRLRKELRQVGQRSSRLRTASGELQGELLAADLYSIFDQAEMIIEQVNPGGGTWTDFDSMREALTVAATWPDRAKAIVWVETGEDYSHVFNLLRYKNKTILMDGQIGAGYRRGAYDRATLASLLRTDSVPDWVDLDSMRLPKAIEDVKDAR